MNYIYNPYKSNNNMKIFYFIGLIIITLFMIAIYIMKERNHSKELEKIDRLEQKIRNEEAELERIRSRTTPCQIDNLCTPGSCYHGSNYKCTWNEEAKRCDQK